MASEANLSTAPKKSELLKQYADLLRFPREHVRAMGPEAYRGRAQGLRDLLESLGVPDLAPVPEVDACRLRPLADHVVVRPAKAKTTTEGGLVIPEVAHEVPMRGTVLAVGPGRVEPGIGTRPIALHVGDEVLFGRYAGVEVTLDGEDVRVMREDDVMGTLAPETPA